MKLNNKGFAITATIYGFLVLFLIVLLSVLAVLKTDNSRSVAISESIARNTFLEVEDVYPNNLTITNGGEYKGSYDKKLVRGKYYFRFRKSTNQVDSTEYYTYLPQGWYFNVEGNVLKISNGSSTNNAVLYKSSDDTKSSNNNDIIDAYLLKRFIANDPNNE